MLSFNMNIAFRGRFINHFLLLSIRTSWAQYITSYFIDVSCLDFTKNNTYTSENTWIECLQNDNRKFNNSTANKRIFSNKPRSFPSNVFIGLIRNTFIKLYYILSSRCQTLCWLYIFSSVYVCIYIFRRKRRKWLDLCEQL